MRIICTVTNDLTYDQRMHRICTSLSKAGYEVELVGRMLQNSAPLQNKTFKQTRLKNQFNKKVFFYAEHNIRLFFYLLKADYDVVCSIDLDTLLSGYTASKFRKKRLVYDAHEYFTELEEVVQRPVVRFIWKQLANFLIPKIKTGYTVSKGYAGLFKKNFNADLKVVRNATIYQKRELPVEREYILYQGAVNVGRGLETLIEAMQMVDYPLVICGKGDVFDSLQNQVKQLNLSHKVKFIGYVSPSDLVEFTAKAKIGITLFTNAGLSNQYSLANRFFDYMHHGVPQLAMDYPEYRKFNQSYEVAHLIKQVDKKEIASALNQLLQDDTHWNRLHHNAFLAAQENNWQQDEAILLKVYEDLAANLHNQ